MDGVPRTRVRTDQYLRAGPRLVGQQLRRLLEHRRIEDRCAIRRRAVATLAALGVPATVVGDAGHLAGVLDIARTRQGVALLAAVGPAPDG
jgi:hypothetical protein